MGSRRPTTTSAQRLRPVRLRRRYTDYAEGSVLIEMGRTRVLCNASVEDQVPDFLRGAGQGWVTAEYAMLPRSTLTRRARESRRGRPDGRSLEISRLIGRALRAAVALDQLPPVSIVIDCDVLQADGGTRCAAVTGGMVALVDALRWLRQHRSLDALPLRELVAAISVGLVDGTPTLDLCYDEDARAAVDMNVVMTASGRFVEIQGTAETEPFTQRQLGTLKNLAARGIADLVAQQKKTLRMK